MSDLNSFTFSGNITTSPEAIQFPDGNHEVTFNVVSIRHIPNPKTNNIDEKKIYIKVKARHFLAQKASQYPKGTFVIVDGSIDFDFWQDGDKNRSAPFVMAESIIPAANFHKHRKLAEEHQALLGKLHLQTQHQNQQDTPDSDSVPSGNIETSAENYRSRRG